MTTAIVLSGGGAKGDFEVGALRYLYNQNIRPDILCATSVGSINAIKLAEGEDPANPQQGLAGLEAIWESLRQNSDMYLEEEWLYHPKMSPKVRDYLTGRSTKLGINAPSSMSAFGDLQKVVEILGGLIFLLDEGAELLQSLNLMNNARSLYNLRPIEDKLNSELDFNKINAWAAQGHKLRLAMVSLETGRLRYATETGAVIERNGKPVPDKHQIPAACQTFAAEAQGLEDDIQALQGDLQDAAPPQKSAIVQAIKAKQQQLKAIRNQLADCLSHNESVSLVLDDLRPAVLASATIPGVFPAVVLGGETYVDGGVRDILPLQEAVNLGASTIYAISASAQELDSSCGQNPHTGNYTSARMLEIVTRSLTDIVINEVALDDKNFRSHGGSGPIPEVLFIEPDIDLHDVTTVDPGLIQIARDYGFMRAADVVAKIDKTSRLWLLATEIACLRKTIWTKENRRYGFPDPTNRAEPTPEADPGLQGEIDQLKLKLKHLAGERASLNGPMPDNISYWTENMELHPWHVPSNSGWSSRNLLGSVDNTAIMLTVARNADGRLEVFTIGTDNGIYHFWQTSANGSWSGEFRLGSQDNKAVNFAVAENSDGRLEVFTVGTDKGIYHYWQEITGGGWSSEARIGLPGNTAKYLTAGRNADGRLEIFTIGTDNGIYHFWQKTPGGNWSNEYRLGAEDNTAVMLAVAENADGRLEVITIGTDNCLYHFWQDPALGAWSSQAMLGAPDNKAVNLAVARNADGRLEVFTIGTDNRIYHFWQDPAQGAWSGQHLLGAPSNTAGQLAVASNADGRLELFTIGTDNCLYHFWQEQANGGWSGESLLGGLDEKAFNLKAGQNLDGRLEVFVIGADLRIYHYWQKP